MGDSKKKFCKNPNTEVGVCCDKDDFSSVECNDRLEEVICSNDLDYEEPNEPDFKKYLICPQSVEVCGSEKELYLKEPDILQTSGIVDEGLTLDRLIPPGHVCSYTVRIQQKD